MRLMLAMAVVLATGVAQAAPMPFGERQTREAVLQTDSPQRAEALKRWLKAPDLVRDLLPREGAWPEGFAAALDVEVREGGRFVALKLRAGRPVSQRALFQQLVTRVTRQPTDAERQAISNGLNGGLMGDQPMPVFRGKKAIFRSDIGIVDENMMYDQNIRLNPPRLISPR